MQDLTGRYVVIQRPGPLPRAISHYTGSWANHAGIMVSPTHLVEAWLPAARLCPVADYERVQFNTDDEMSPLQRRQVAAFALSVVGCPYDLVHFAGLSLQFLFGVSMLHRWPMRASAMICSHLVARAGQAAGLDWTGGHPLAHVTPATLAARLAGNDSVTMAPRPAPSGAST